MGHTFGRAMPIVGVAAAVLAVIAFGAVGTGVIHLTPQPASMAQACVQGSALVPTLFGDDTTTQIRISTPDFGTLSSDAFSRLETNELCVTSAGAVTVVPPPAPRNGDLAAAATPGIKLASPTRVNDTSAGVGGGPVTGTRTIPVTAVSGTYADQVVYPFTSFSYKLKLTDGQGATVTATAT